MPASRVVLLAPIEMSREAAALARGLDGFQLDGLALMVSTEATVPSGRGIVAVVALPSVAVTARHATALPDLRVVCAASTGLDHIDVAGLQALGVVVTNAQGHSDIEVADHTIAMIAGLLRGLSTSDAQVRSGLWDSRETRARRITGTTLGLAGFGPIAQRVARKATGLDMVVLAWSRSRAAGVDRQTGALLVASLDELLSRSDVVSLHLPVTDETTHLFGDAAFALMADGSYLVNCSRGGLVDTHALGRALTSGRLTAAALDVLEQEPPAADDPALSLPRTVLTPHAAWFSPDSAFAAYEIAAANIRRVLET